MIFTHCKMIQEGEAALFYRFNKDLNGYMIAAVLVEDSMAGKMSFAKIWRYFVSNIVQNDDIYCGQMKGAENEMFTTYLNYHTEINGRKIFKVDNFLKNQYSSFAQAEKGKQRGS